jgi:hypothetical protein
MYYRFILVFFVFTLQVKAQIHEIGAFLGGSNFVGDAGSTTYIAPSNFAYGIVYKKNQNSRLTYRFSFLLTNLKSTDLDSNEPSRKARGYFFSNSLKEMAVGIEFNFSDFNIEKKVNKIVPYTHVGLSYVFSNDAYSTPTKIEILKNSNSFAAIPMTFGIKSNVLNNIIMAAEVGARYTFTDNLDGSNAKDRRFFKFGNINNNDWYVFSGITITYSFGQKECYCAQ